MEAIAAIVMVGVSILASLTTWIYLRRFLNAERLALIEKGASPDIIMQTPGSKMRLLRFGLLLIGVGLGILVGNFFGAAIDNEEVGFFSMIFVFGGAGLLLAYKLEGSQNNN